MERKTVRRVIRFGKIAYFNNKSKRYAVEVGLELSYTKDGLPAFSAMADIWNTKRTDIVMGGQCLDDIWKYWKDQLKNPDLFEKILGLWKRNHLNDHAKGGYRPISPEDLQTIQELLGIPEQGERHENYTVQP